MSNEVTLTVTDKPVVPAFAAPGKVCEGGSLTLTSPTPIDWRGNTIPQTTGWQIELTSGTWTTFAPATAMVYSTHNGKQLRYFATNGCGTSYSTTQTIQIDQAVTANAGTVGTISCICSTATTTATMNAVAASTGTGTWTKVSGTGGTITNPNSASTTITGLGTGQHTYRWTVTNGLCSVYDEVTFSVTADTTAPTFSLSSNTANATSVGSCTFQVPDLSSLAINKADNCTAVGSLVYTQTPAAGTVITAQQTVSITLTDACDNVSAAQNVTVNVPAALQITNITVTNPKCASDKASAVVTVTGGTAPYQYSLTSATAGDFANLATITNLNANQTVWIKDANGCTTSGSINVTMVTAITATLAKTDVTTPGGTNGTITVSNPQGGNGDAIQYEYRASNGTTAVQSWSSLTTATGLPAGTYKIYARNSGQTCEYYIGEVTINEPAAINGTATPTAITCNSGSDGQIVAEVSSGGTSPYQYQLETSTGTVVTPYGAAKALGLTETFTGLSAGTYQVRVKDNNGATALIQTGIAVGQPNAMTVSGTPTAVTCNGGASGALALSATGGNSGGYYFSASTGADAYNATLNDASFAGLTAGTYTIKARDTKGCVASNTVVIDEPTALQITNIAVTNPKCASDKASAVVTVTGGTTPYQYSLTSATAGDFANLAAITNLNANQTVWIKDANGCTTSGSINVTMVTAITATVTTADVTIPGGSDGTIIVSNPQGGNGDAIQYEYRQSDGTTAVQSWSSSTTATGLPAGTYKIYARNAGQTCEYLLGTVTIDEPAAINGTATSTNVTCNGGSNGQIIAEVSSGGTSPYQYQLETSTGTVVTPYGTAKALGLTETFTGLAAGTYQVRLKDNNGAIARIAQNIVISEPAAMTVANITSPNAVCAGGNLSLTAPTVTNAETALSSQGWEIETAVGSGTFTAFNNPVTYADNSKKIRYTATNTCRTVRSNEAVITVNDKPAVSVNWTQPVCEDGNLTALVTVLDSKGSAVTSYAWKLDGTTISTTASLSYTAAAADNGKSLTVEVTNSCGTTVSGPGTVVINSKPHIGNKTASIGNNEAFSITPTDGVNGDIVPSGTTYTWTVVPNTNVPDASAQATAVNAPISQTLINTGGGIESVVYTVTPTSGAGCVGSAFTITVTISPSPRIANVAQTIDSGDAFSVTPVSGGGASGNDIVPAGTTYTWTVAPNANITNASAQATAVNAPISQTLTNTTDTQQVIVYTVTPTSGSNVGTPFTITVTVNPRPRIADITTTINSGESFSVTPATGGGTSSNDLVPGNTEYTWTVVDNPNVTGESAGSGNAPLGQQLTNTTDEQQTVVYTVTPKAGTAAGGSFTISVVVNPQPRIANVAIEICTGDAFSETPITGGGTSSNDLVPSNTLYTWTVSAAAGIGGTSAQPAPTAAPISQMLTNTTGADLQAVYTVTPTAGTSAGSAFTLTVTVHSTPAPTTTDYTATCLLTGTGNWSDLVTATGTLNWYDSPTDTTPVAAPTTYDKNSLASNRSYWVSQVLNGCEGPKAEVKVNISSNPQPAQVSNYAVCATTGTAITWASRVLTPAASLLWYSADIDASLLALEPVAFDPNVAQQVSYWVVAVDAQGCKGQRTEVKVAVHALPASTVAKGNDVSCPGGSDGEVQLVSVDAGTAPYTYSWRNAQNAQVSATAQASGLPAGIYTLTVTDNNNCVATSAPITIIDTPDTVAPVIAGTVPSAQASNANDCIFRVVDFTAAVKAISSDNCTPQANLTVTQQPAVGTPITQNMLVTVTVKDASGNETTTAVEVTLPTMPTLTFPAITPLCANEAPVELQGSNSGLFVGTYTGMGVVGTQFDPSVAGAGTHLITYTIRPYGCVMTETQTAAVNPVPEGIAIETPSVCPGDALNFTATAGYETYEWTIDGAPDNMQTGNVYAYGTGTTSGQQIQIQLTVVSDKGCRTLPISAEANLKTIPTIALTQQPVFCVAEKGTTIRWRDLVVASENQVRWYETESSTVPVTPDNIDQSVAGQYLLYAAAVSTNGCQSNYRLPVKVTVNESPKLEKLDKSDLDNIEVLISGGAKPYVYDIEGVRGNADNWINLGFLPIGKHYLLVIDAKGCQVEITVPIVEYHLIPDEYFSPNDDGKQDLWTIKNLDKYLDANITIHIFDRTGKELLRQNAHEFAGWDGKYAGKDLPSTDYWYLIRIDKTGDRMTGHFSLKR